ncbi:hypothetical protein K491DRAFT_69784 [Lophiostoma macrostomum CBS 122681]|uniref:Uncharacterized protein n=1 Tax=Lophiostoma macrostomum CBS 122681 TaxID=1314788 RepID=A0A6A6SWP5_9PLEO|nr:hypothetical protein K491DRAFT_69784 [Lophiostoma macrostomum CBS 122681]
MVDVIDVATQLQQWTFEKTSPGRPERSDSSASSPDLYHHENEALRIAAAVDNSKNVESKDSISLQGPYMSSEEDLSPMDGNSSDSDYDDVSIHDFEKEYFSARRMSMARFDKGKSCDMAVMVSYVSAGRPKVIQLANGSSPIRESAQRSASLAQLPITAINKLRKADQSNRLSLRVPQTTSTSRSSSPSPLRAAEPRRPSTGHGPFTHSNSSSSMLHSSETSSFSASSARSTSPAPSEHSLRPATASARPHSQLRSSLYVTSSITPMAFSPLTPQSPEPHSFLSSDPYENSTTNAASPIIKQAPHRRLRSISQKLSLAKISIGTSSKNPYTPTTPQTAPLSSSFTSPKNRLRRNSRVSRAGSIRGPPPEIPPVPTLGPPNPQVKPTTQKLVARGADERAPMLELPPFPDEPESDPVSSIKARRIRKRKSIMDLL